MKKDFWPNATVALLGGGSWGSVLGHLASRNVGEVRMWVREEDRARIINSTRSNPRYVSHLQFSERVKAFSEPERIFERPVQMVIWALPSKVCREEARRLARFFTGEEILIHATKGVEEGTLRRISDVLADEIPCPRIGVLSGPNLAEEVARGEPAAAVVASRFEEVSEAGRAVFRNEQFRVYAASDVAGVEWAGTLKNILAISSGALDALGFGWNSRAMLISRGLAEMVRFGTAMGGEMQTFLGLAGVGDLLATCSSSLSRNYRVGFRLAKGDPLPKILEELGSTAEGVRTAISVWKYAQIRKIEMPITESVYKLVQGELDARRALQELMLHPAFKEL